MKQGVLIFTILLIIIGCNQPADNNHILQTRIDSLQNKLATAYKPGFGEFMGEIQVHHAKLWFAGQNKNWKLADFEIGEIRESLEAIQQYCTDRTESKSIGMIDLPMDSLSSAIRQKNPAAFKSSFVLLTVTCNNCHKTTSHEFNVIKIPDGPPFSNQNFKLEKTQ